MHTLASCSFPPNRDIAALKIAIFALLFAKSGIFCVRYSSLMVFFMARAAPISEKKRRWGKKSDFGGTDFGGYPSRIRQILKTLQNLGLYRGTHGIKIIIKSANNTAATPYFRQNDSVPKKVRFLAIRFLLDTRRESVRIWNSIEIWVCIMTRMGSNKLFISNN